MRMELLSKLCSYTKLYNSYFWSTNLISSKKGDIYYNYTGTLHCVAVCVRYMKFFF